MLNFFRSSFYRLLFCLGYDFLFSSVPCYICGDLCIWKNDTSPKLYRLSSYKERTSPTISSWDSDSFSNILFRCIFSGLVCNFPIREICLFFFFPFLFLSPTCLASLALTIKVSGLSCKKATQVHFLFSAAAKQNMPISCQCSELGKTEPNPSDDSQISWNVWYIFYTNISQGRSYKLDTFSWLLWAVPVWRKDWHGWNGSPLFIHLIVDVLGFELTWGIVMS